MAWKFAQRLRPSKSQQLTASIELSKTGAIAWRATRLTLAQVVAHFLRGSFEIRVASRETSEVRAEARGLRLAEETC